MSYEAESSIEVQIINDTLVHNLTEEELLEKYPFRQLMMILQKVATHPEYMSEKARIVRKVCRELRPIEDYPELYV
jgi:hypothetical protein